MRDIEEALDNALLVNRETLEMGDDDFVNLLFESRAGFGKTARIEKWAKDNGINLFHLDAKTLDPTDLSGVPAPDKNHTKAVRLAMTELDPLDRPNSVLFLDELNRADPVVRATLLTLIKDHIIPDAREEGHFRKFDNLLFTVAAENPSSAKRGGNYNVYPLDPAERSRFRFIQVDDDKEVFREYFVNRFTELSEKCEGEKKTKYKRMAELSNTIMQNEEFHFDTEAEEATAANNDYQMTNPRSLMQLIKASQGNKDTLIAMWAEFCNPEKKPMIMRILKDYKDSEDKPNSPFKVHNETAWEKFKKNTQ